MKTDTDTSSEEMIAEAERRAANDAPFEAWADPIPAEVIARELARRLAETMQALKEADAALEWIEENTDWYEARGAEKYQPTVLAARARAKGEG